MFKRASTHVRAGLTLAMALASPAAAQTTSEGERALDEMVTRCVTPSLATAAGLRARLVDQLVANQEDPSTEAAFREIVVSCLDDQGFPRQGWNVGLSWSFATILREGTLERLAARGYRTDLLLAEIGNLSLALGGLEKAIPADRGISEEAFAYLQARFAESGASFLPDDKGMFQLLAGYLGSERVLNSLRPVIRSAEEAVSRPPAPDPSRLERPDPLTITAWKACFVEGVPDVTMALWVDHFIYWKPGLPENADLDKAAVQIDNQAMACARRFAIPASLQFKWIGVMRRHAILEKVGERLRSRGFPLDVLDRAMMAYAQSKGVTIDKLIYDPGGWPAEYRPHRLLHDSIYFYLDKELRRHGAAIEPADPQVSALLTALLFNLRAFHEGQNELFAAQ